MAIPAAGSVDVEMTPDVLVVPEGTHVPFNAELRVDGRQVVSVSKTVFVRSNFDLTGFPPVCADINNDGFSTLVDLVVALHIMAGKDVSLTEHGDCSGDGKIGLPEVFFILRQLQ